MDLDRHGEERFLLHRDSIAAVCRIALGNDSSICTDTVDTAGRLRDEGFDMRLRCTNGGTSHRFNSTLIGRARAATNIEVLSYNLKTNRELVARTVRHKDETLLISQYCLAFR